MKVNTIRDLENLIIEAQPPIIGIDGRDGAGKTTLAEDLGKRLGYSVIHLDEFLEKNTGSYFSALRLSDLNKALESTTKPVIVEGCLLLQTLEAIGYSPSFSVYMQRHQYGYWVDEEDYVTTGDIEAFINLRNKDVKEFSKVSAPIFGEEFDEAETDYLSGLTKELIRYHSKRLPHKLADVVFCRDVSSS